MFKFGLIFPLLTRGQVHFLNFLRSQCIFTAYSYGNFLSWWRATSAKISSLTCEMCPFSMTVFVVDVWLAVSSPQQVFIVTWSHVQDLIKFPSHLWHCCSWQLNTHNILLLSQCILAGVEEQHLRKTLGSSFGLREREALSRSYSSFIYTHLFVTLTS